VADEKGDSARRQTKGLKTDVTLPKNTPSEQEKTLKEHALGEAFRLGVPDKGGGG